MGLEGFAPGSFWLSTLSHEQIETIVKKVEEFLKFF